MVTGFPRVLSALIQHAAIIAGEDNVGNDGRL
jgi:hypothetical protein